MAMTIGSRYLTARLRSDVRMHNPALLITFLTPETAFGLSFRIVAGDKTSQAVNN